MLMFVLTSYLNDETIIHLVGCYLKDNVSNKISSWASNFVRIGCVKVLTYKIYFALCESNFKRVNKHFQMEIGKDKNIFNSFECSEYSFVQDDEMSYIQISKDIGTF